MEIQKLGFKAFILKNYVYVFYILSLVVPFAMFVRTMLPASTGWDTTWLHIQVPGLYVGQTTGFPIAFLTGKLFSFLPIGTMAFRLNLYSVFWGAMTLFILFIFIKNILKNEYYIAFITVLFFGFFKVFWLQTNRFEVYTLSTFFSAIIMLTGYYWFSTRSNKFLYLYYFLIGLSFTNHPISVFLAPAFIFFPIYTEWRQVFRLKKFFIILALIIFPNLLYLYIPIRSLQGFGNVTSLEKFIYYISGERWRGEFGFKGISMLKEMAAGYLDLLKGDFTWIVLIFFIAGLVFLVLKKRKFFYLIISLIVLNFIPILLYEKKPTHFYLTTMIVFLCIPFACGLAWLKDGIVIFYNRFIKPRISIKAAFLRLTENTANIQNKDKRKFIALKTVFFLLFFALITLFPLNLFASNFITMDKSNDTYEYDYWLKAVQGMKQNSIIVSNSLTAHIPVYIDQFEVHKNIEVKTGFELEKLRQIIKENLGKKDIYYTDAHLPDLSQYFDVEKYGDRFHKKDFDESFNIYKVKGVIVDTSITASSEILEIYYSQKTMVTYDIVNNSGAVLNINSIELDLPESLKFIGMDNSSDMESPPGISKGIYMWTAGPYQVQPGSTYKVAFNVQAVVKTEGEIKFRITTGNMYVEGPSIKIIVK